MHQQFLLPELAENVKSCDRCERDCWRESLDSLGQCPACHAETHCLCDYCENEFHEDEIITIEETDTYLEEKVCDACYDKNIFRCKNCDVERHKEDEHWRNDICKSCKDQYFICSDCSDFVHNDNCHHEDICDCCGEDYSQCHACDEWFHCDDLDCGYCKECKGDDDDFDDYTPPFKTYGKGRLYGIELELECEEGTRAEAVENTRSIFGRHAQIKHDSSLGHGFEIASMPGSAIIQEEWWEEFFDNLPDDIDVRKTCGMHVHIQRSTITPLTLGKMIVFINANENRKFISKIAGRSFIYGGSYEERKLTDKHSGCKYEAVNTRNDKTIEIRIFASTIDKEEFMARFEFVQALIDFCQHCSINNLTANAFLDWLGGQPYKALRRLNKSKIRNSGIALSAKADRIKRERSYAMPDERLKRFPQWVQSTIVQLERDNARLERSLEAAYKSRGQAQEDLQDAIDILHAIRDGKGDPAKLATDILNKLIYGED